MRKLFSYFVLLAAGLLVGTNAWANYITPEIEAKPAAPEINEVLNTPRRAPQGDAVVVAKVGGVEYTSLQAAILASTDVVPAILQCDVTQGSDVTINQDVNPHTLDMNNHNITFTGAYDFNLYYNAKLTITGTGTITVNSKYNAFYILGLPNGYPGENIVITIGENVTVNNTYSVTSGGNTTKYYVFGILPYNNGHYANGIVINFNGKNKEGFFATVLGTITAQDESVPVFNVGPKAEIGTIYAAGFAKWTIDGKMDDQFEIRAGELTINSGEITGDDETIHCEPNGSGGTTWGAAVAVAQHTTKEPIVVTINGGKLEGLMALIQTNPQNNSEADYQKLKVNVYGGYFKSTHTEGGTLYENVLAYGGTVTYAADAMCISQNKRIFLMGGYYNYDPVEFVAAGYQSHRLADIPESDRTAEDNAAMEAGYYFKIGAINPEDAVQTTACDNCSDWKNDAATLWSDGETPTDATPVKIVDKEVVITTPANAYSVELANTGSGEVTKLTIKDGGMLMVGAGGVSGATKLNFVVEDGGMLCVAPNAEDYQHPEGTVIISSDYARRKDPTADAKEVSDLSSDDLCWRHIACPTINADRDLILSQTGKTYINTWNLRNGWESKTAADVKTPFVGYNISTTLASTTRETDTILYTFKGQLAGNTVELLKFANTGFTFFGNSFLAPIDIRELLTSLDANGDVESSVILYHHENDEYKYVNRATYALPTTPAEIEPLQGFFIFSAEPASVQYDYIKSVWDAFCAKARAIEMGAASAPARQQTTMDNNFDAIACVQLSSIDGKQDKVYLFEGAEYSSALDNGYDARKMNTNGLQIAAVGENDQLAIIATDNLEGTELSLSTTDATQYSLSFSNVSGKALAIYDVITATTINIEEGATYNFMADANATLDGRFRVVSPRQMPTDIVENKVTPAKEGIYTILGQYVGKDNIWQSLPKGVYVVNGEKMVR